MQVVVQAFPLPTCQRTASQTMHSKKFRFLALTLSCDVYAFRKAITIISTRWGCPLWSYEASGVLISLTKLLQPHAAPWRPGWRAQLLNIPSKVCFRSMENDRMSNASFPFSTWLSFSSWYLQKGKYDLTWTWKQHWCGKRKFYTRPNVENRLRPQ